MPVPGRTKWLPRWRATLLPIAFAAALAGCGSKKAVTDSTATGAIAAPVTTQDFRDAADAWGARYSASPNDKATALGYAGALIRVGRTDQALAVLQKTAIRFPEDREVLAAYGKGLAAQGRLREALEIVRRAQTPEQPDWRLLSAEAAILDQLNQNGEARRLYAQAIDLAPSEPTLWSNLGMSYLLTNDLSAAEKALRKAVGMNGADSRVRQNLALVVGLQGRFDEAEEIARGELTPEEAEANIAYLKSMLAERNNWQDLGDRPNG